MEEALLVQLPENDAGSRNGGTALPEHGTVSIIGRRREMEDAVAAELDFVRKGGKSYSFFGVYDGHGGWRVARACSEMLHKLVAEIVVEDGGEEIESDVGGEEVFGRRIIRTNSCSDSTRTMEAAAILVQLAMARGSHDNISVVVVDLTCCH
ncbi:hypothetical protein SASPL_152959 [Salvia splendens]|uniref:protein-serine/threonine phosphatase n=1 Tax=Salvia splendens TaxID=180675 RepID=A0A8X8Z1R7_SALSN|nr:hypothetical protein SASPL_152959 [Salvia splendens]